MKNEPLSLQFWPVPLTICEWKQALASLKEREIILGLDSVRFCVIVKSDYSCCLKPLVLAFVMYVYAESCNVGEHPDARV